MTSAVTPRVSVIVPVRDRKPLMQELLEGLERQTFEDFELIVVDDGSSDGSGDEASRSRAGRVPVRVVRIEGEGAVAARRVGVSHSAGEILAFTDSDCVPSPEWLAAGVVAIDRGTDLVQGRVEPIRDVLPLERSIWVVKEDGLYPTCNVFYRRSAYDAAGGFDASIAGRLRFRLGRDARHLGFGEDTLLGWRVRRSGPTAFAPDALVRHQVLAPGLKEAVTRAYQVGAFPAMIREVPELRATLLRRGVVLGDGSRLWALAAVVALLVGRPVPAALALVVWARGKRGHLGRSRKAVPGLAFQLGLDVVQDVALLTGAVGSRTLVL
jgi:hypothetical protein